MTSGAGKMTGSHTDYNHQYIAGGNQHLVTFQHSDWIGWFSFSSKRCKTTQFSPSAAWRRKVSSLTASYRSFRQEISFSLGKAGHADGNSIKLQDEVAASLTPVNSVH
jgi:hypothetical protein